MVKCILAAFELFAVNGQAIAAPGYAEAIIHAVSPGMIFTAAEIDQAMIT